MKGAENKTPTSSSWSRASDSLSVIVAAATLIASVLAGVTTFRGSRQAHDAQVQTEAVLVGARAKELTAEIQDQQAHSAQIEEALKRMASTSTKGAGGLSEQDREALSEVIESNKQLSSRMSVLEGALMNNPEKALALPLLRKDVDEAQGREKADVDVMKAEIDHLYTFSEWFMGLIVATAVSILALALPRLLASRRESATTAQQGEEPHKG